MRLAVDATALLDVRTGVGNFVHAVLERFGRRQDLVTTAFPVSLRGHRGLRNAAPRGIRVVTPPLPARVLRRAWMAADTPPIDWFIGRHDVVYGPNFVVPPSAAARVATIHDLTSVRFPELCTADTRQYPELIRRAAADGAWLHTVSEAVRREVLDFFDIDPDRVITVPNGFRPPEGGDPRSGRRAAGHDAYVLAVGTVEPRKDLPTLVRAIDLLGEEGHEIPLVHSGPEGWGTEAVDDAIAAMRRPELVTRLGPTSDALLADLYAGARVFAYPSLYEGFGLPVLEAMSAGIPVVATQDPAIVEVSAGAAALVPVGDSVALASAIEELWFDEAARSRRSASGSERSSHFSWDRCAEGLLDVLRKAGADGERP